MTCKVRTWVHVAYFPGACKAHYFEVKWCRGIPQGLNDMDTLRSLLSITLKQKEDNKSKPNKALSWRDSQAQPSLWSLRRPWKASPWSLDKHSPYVGYVHVLPMQVIPMKTRWNGIYRESDQEVEGVGGTGAGPGGRSGTGGAGSWAGGGGEAVRATAGAGGATASQKEEQELEHEDQEMEEQQQEQEEQ